MIRRLALWTCALAFSLLSASSTLAQNPHWPTLDEQLRNAHVAKGSSLEKLIRENQDFKLLRADEVADRHGLPPWLKVFWRKGHPEATYSAADPTGGYPHVLKEVYEWMVSHQDLRPGSHEPGMRPGSEPQPPPVDEDE